jgi:Protein of unknown function (DUF3455)
MNRLVQGVAVIGLVLAAQGKAPGRPEVPESLKAPAGEEVILAAHATGTQIYVCQQGSDQKYAWAFKAPEAELTDATGKRIVHHSPGPTWKHINGHSADPCGGWPATGCEHLRCGGERQRVEERVLGGLLFLRSRALKSRGRPSSNIAGGGLE